MSKTRIEALEAKKAKIDAQLKAARSRERTQKRKDDTRRKIIVGGLVQKHAERNPDSALTRILLKLIQEGVTSDRDRALFDLDPLRQTPDPSQEWAQASKKTRSQSRS